MNNKKSISLILGAMCIVLSCGIAVQVRTINNIGTTTSTNDTENELRDAILRTKEKYDNLYAEVENAEKVLEKERENSTENNSELSELEGKIKTINTQLGLTDVEGQGVIVTLDDSKTIGSSSFANLVDLNKYVIHDTDILTIVNELKNAGAEAISVNGQRIVTNTVIECDGTVIKVNGVKIGAPFEIKAIGMKEVLLQVKRLGGYLWNLENRYYLDVSCNSSDNIEIPKYTGTYKFNYATSK